MGHAGHLAPRPRLPEARAPEEALCSPNPTESVTQALPALPQATPRKTRTHQAGPEAALAPAGAVPELQTFQGSRARRSHSCMSLPNSQEILTPKGMV